MKEKFGNAVMANYSFILSFLHSLILLNLPALKATLAQLVEQLIRNEQVEGSSPFSGSDSKLNSSLSCPSFFYW